MTLVQRSLAILLGGFLTFAVFAYVSPSMDMVTMRGQMADHVLCPFMGTTPACMGVLQHLAHWQTTFAAVLVDLIPFLTLLLTASALLWYVRKRPWEPFSIPRHSLQYQLNPSGILSRHTLQEAFSNGIIHSKAY